MLPSHCNRQEPAAPCYTHAAFVRSTLHFVRSLIISAGARCTPSGARSTQSGARCSLPDPAVPRQVHAAAVRRPL